ncbi:ABC transporter substrate-binding protein [Lutibacter sp. B2]|nr:ABC transporter substrate-binding protein [Lutibacter sp. B2]
MVGKKNVKRRMVALVVAGLFLVGCNSAPVSKEGKKENRIQIGITQIVEHPALDAARKGFVDALESKGFKDGEKVEIEFQNAQGDMTTTQTIAQKFVSEKKDMILAIATPSAQSAFNATKEIPIIVTAVTDPVSAGLVKTMENPDTNVTGTSDATPIGKQFKLLKTLIPKAKKVGILYNTSETNSEIQINRAKEIAKDFDIEIITSGVTSVNEIPQSLQSIIEKIDVLYVPTDNMIASAMPLVSAKCTEENIPIIGAEKAHVENGALATEGIDYYQLGFQTGITAVEVLNGKEPKDLAVTTLKDTQLVINEDIAKKLKIEIPKEIKENAEFIKGGE